MRRTLIGVVGLTVALFLAGSLTAFDWKNVVGQATGSSLNDAGGFVRSAAGMSATPERVAVAPGAAVASKSGQPPSVTVAKPVVRSIIEWDEYTARMDAVDSVELRARVAGSAGT